MVLAFGLVICIYVYAIHQKRKKKAADPVIYINNAMIISIGIRDYDQNDNKEDSYPNLMGVEMDIQKISELTGFLNYDMDDIRNKFYWNAHEIESYLSLKAQEFEDNIGATLR